MNIILEGIVGSTAYGMDTENSDIDVAGIFLHPTKQILGLSKLDESVVTTNPDSTYHELKKFASLAIKANPTVLELLFLDSYTIETELSNVLLSQRKAFLSTSTVFNSYYGYAMSQQSRLFSNRSYGKTERQEKLVRHAARLLWQGEQLLLTGNLPLHVGNKRDEFFHVGTLLSEQNRVELLHYFDSAMNRLDQAQHNSCLPEEPHTGVISDFLIYARLKELAHSGGLRFYPTHALTPDRSLRT